MTKPTVLVVDDEADLRLILRSILEPVARVIEAGSGAAGLLALERVRPTLVIMDASMPGLDGLETLRRALARDPGLPVVMLTGNRDLDLARSALKAGARAFITKPFDEDIILAEVERLLRRDEPGPSEDGSPWRIVEPARPAKKKRRSVRS